MKVDVARIEAIARGWPADVRMVLLHGADAAASNDHAAQIARQFADPSNPVAVETLTGAAVAADPAALVAAASALSLFGERTLIRVDGLDDGGAVAVAGIVEGPPGNPIIAIAGVLKKTSKLLMLAEKSKRIAALVSYELAPRDAFRLVGELGARFGVKPSRPAATALFEAAGGDRALMRSEVEKLALYLDGAPDRPMPAEIEDVAAVGVDVRDADHFELVSAVVGGHAARACRLLGRLGGLPGIVTLRAVERRLTLLLSLRGVVDGGASPATAVEAARPPIFWKEKETIAAELGLWSTAALVRGLAEVLAAERAIKSAGGLGETLADAAMLALAQRAAAARRG